MNIGIDVDGVLTNLENYQLKYGKKYFGEDAPIHETEIDIKEIFGCTKAEREKFWIKYIWKYCLQEPSRSNAAVTIQKLKEEGHKIHIITSRAHVMEDNVVGKLFRKMLYDWLEKEKIPYDSITLCSERGSEIDKKIACEAKKIDVMIDDKKENVETLSKITNVLCFDAKYNQECNGENITRVSNWNQIYNEINRLANQKYFQKKSSAEIEKMSLEEKRKYFNDLKMYLSNLPFEKEKNDKTEKNYKTLCKIGLPIFNSKFHPTVFNAEKIPDENGVLYVANHNNYYDQFPIISALGCDKPVHFLTATKMLNMKRGIIYLKTGAVSVDRENSADRENASDEVKKIILNGGNVFIFPEGRTNRNEDYLLDFKPGAVAIARDIGCKIVPIAVNDNYKKEDGELCVRFGDSITVNCDDNVIEKTEELKNIIAKLKQENIDYVESMKLVNKKGKC